MVLPPRGDPRRTRAIVVFATIAAIGALLTLIALVAGLLFRQAYHLGTP